MASLKAEDDSKLSIANHPPTRLPGPNLLHLLVQPPSHNGQPAIDFLASDSTRTTLSYAELHHAADSLAARISALAGPREDDPKPFVVPVLIPQSPDLYITLLAILKAGGAFCPMNLDIPPERAKFILEDVGAQIVITSSDLASRLPQDGPSVQALLVNREAPEPDALASTFIAPRRQPLPTDLAYLMFTSGSTGTPKGVGISHDAVTQSLLAHDRHIPPFSRFLQFAAPTFDVSVFEIFFPLFRGKTLVSCARQAMLNDLPEVLRTMDVDACELTPSVAGSLLRKRENAPGLRLLLTIGEMLTRPVVEEFGGGDGMESMLWGMYGPTEAAIHCTLKPAFARDMAVGNIGVPLDTVSAFILKIPEEDDANSEFKVLPRGEIGELAVGGHQLAEGYLNRPELTSKAFLDTPYGRLYRTGDKARMLGDGTLECLGRISHGQVKLRGQRMELGEVEQAALRTQGCHSAVAAVIDSNLILFCAVDDGMGDSDASVAVMQSCRQWLPGFMLPTDIVVAERFPRLASGKVDRKALVAEYETQMESTESQKTIYRDELEEQLCVLASRSLGVKVEPDQDLLRAGLDSLTAIKLASELRGAGFDIGAVDILDFRTVPSLCSRLRSTTQSQASERAPEIADSPSLDVSEIVANHPLLSEHGRPIEAIFPCTPLQASMLAETAANPRAYCNWVELSVPNTYSEATIRSWFLQLTQANEILRTGFIHHSGQFLQVIFQTFDVSSIITAKSATRDFSISHDTDYLRPFRVQIIPPSSAISDTTVVLQLHHAVYDGWSLDMAVTDLTALARGQQPRPRPQFRRVLSFHRSDAFIKNSDASPREFWAATLRGFQPPALPILVPKTTESKEVLHSTRTFFFDVHPEEVKLTLQDIGCGPQTIFQAALAWLWSSMVGSEDVVVGSVQSGRTIAVVGIEDIVGPCFASVPIRTNLSQVRTIRDLVFSIHTANREALPHSTLSLSDIKWAAGIRPGQSIYDVLFIYQESLHSRNQDLDILEQVARQDYLETKLLVEVEPMRSGFECRFTHHADVFPVAQVSIMGDSIDALVSYMLEHLDSELSSMAHAFPQELLSVFNPEPTTFAGVPDLARAVEKTAAESPDKDAICFAHGVLDGVLTTSTVTFAALNETADRIAWHLGQQGVQVGEAVAIVMEKSFSLYTGILAILKTGCAYLPLLPSTPTARIQTILQQAGVKICLVDTATRDKLQHQVPCNLIDLQSLNHRSMPGFTSRPDPDPNRLAVIIYTSGSTGVPKGVCVTQLNIMSNLDVLSRIYPVKRDSRILQSCSQAFDVSVFEIFFAWTQGMCLCSATNDTLFEDLEQSIRELGVTHLSMTPTVASLVDPEKVPRVEFLVTAGEAMTEIVLRKWGDKLYQGYGPSETTNICSVKKMGPGQAVQHLGWSLENTSTFVLARDSLDVVPYGCVGELCFGGDQVAQGYLGMEELTAAKFINHPTYGRMYRSGDLGRMLPDGSMVIVGRVDEQIKIRGQRVELNEITETIRQSGDVADCASLFLRGDDTGTRDQIVAFVVPRRHEGAKFEVLAVGDDLKGEIQSLYGALESRLPSYMVPSAIIPISVLPTTASGKLDRAGLMQTFQILDIEYLELVSHGAELNTDQEEWTDNELRVVEAIHAALNVNRGDIQRWTPLTMLGLDSMSAFHLSKHLHEQLGVRFPMSLILQNPSVAGLARALPQIGGVLCAQQSETVDLLPKALVEKINLQLISNGTGFSKILPCTPLQEAMLATSAGEARYLNRMLFRVTGDVTRLRDSWNAMVIRHDILRTCFRSTDDASWPILQVVLDEWKAPWHDFDASQSGLDECILQHAQTVPSALDSMKPAVSFAIIRQEDSTFLSFVCHHALYDGVAIARLLYEVEQHFSGFSLPPAPAYDQFLSKSLTLPESTNSFWLARLDGYQPKLTTHLSSKLAATGSCSLISELDMPRSQILAHARDSGVSLLAVTQSAWAHALGLLFRTNDVCFGNVVNGRSVAVEGINELVAPCFNTIPVRMDLSRAQRNIDLMAAFHHFNAEVLEYQFTPLRRIQSLFPQHGERRLFDTLLLLQPPSRVLDQSLWTLERDDGEMDVPLVCEVVPDVNLDRLFVKMHGVESQPLPPGVLALLFDLFAHSLRHCLRFPGSHLALGDMPRELAERLASVEYQPPQVVSVTTQQTDSTEEWTPTEMAVRSVLTTLSPTKSEHIRRTTTIYQLGLDSIRAVQVASMLQKAGYRVLASDVIEHPTCESLARYLDSLCPDSRVTATYDLATFESQVQPQIAAHGVAMDLIAAVIPCTPIQCAMMAQFIKFGGRDYLNLINFELGDGVTPAQLAGAWQAVSIAHPILWTGVVPVEHPDCAFAMVQYRAQRFAPAVTILSGAQAAAFDLRHWRNAVAQAALETPHSQLWRVAIVDAEKGMTMHLAIHHALYDAYSLQLILDDLSRATMDGVLWPRAPTQEAVADIFGQITLAAKTAAGFWTSHAGDVVVNTFPVMTPLKQKSRIILTESTVSGVALTALEEAASKSGHTPQVILQAAWTRVLSTYLGEPSVVFGVVFSGRNTEATRDASFPCISTLPVIATNMESNRTLLDRMLRYNTDLFKQQHQPLTRIQQWLGCPDAKLFDTLLVYLKLDRDTPEGRPWRIVSESASVDYPVSIEVEPAAGGRLRYQMTFSENVLPREQARILLEQFDATVRHLAHDPDGHEQDLVRSSPNLFSVLPPEVPEIPTSVKLLHQFVEMQASRAPNNTALHFVERFDRDVPVGRRWTYQELDANGNRVARMLLPHVKPGDIVAVCFDKCPEAYFSILGILKAGCAFLALDPAAPQSRNEFILQDSGASVLVTSRQRKDNMDLAVSIPVLGVDEDSLATMPADPPTLSRELEPNDVCFCLYTSGTTGTPKGCEITHNNVVQCMLAFQHIFRGHWQDDSRWLQFASLHFDVSVLEQYWSWSVGITLVAAPRDLILEDLSGAISRLGITHIDLTPSLARLVHPDDAPSLCKGVFITGGEALKQEILDAWGDKKVIYNFYGPTEATIGVTVFPQVPANGRASNIGRQFVNVGSYVLKPDTEQPVLRGGVGELCVSGPLVGKGYLKREDLTAEKFPILQHFGERVYRTGDLVRLLHDGCFEFLGRADDQVKLRGQRLEIGEINHCIREGVEAVKDVATLVVRNEAQQKDVIVSFVVAGEDGQQRVPGQQLEIAESSKAAQLCRRAREACRSKLPGYMVPTYVIQLPFIPLSANNKVEVKNLRKFFASLGQDRLMALSSSSDRARGQLSTVGTRIVNVLGTMLKGIDTSSVTPASNIFELGVDSISVLRFFRALQKGGFAHASPSLILQHPQIGDLADALVVHQPVPKYGGVAAARQLVHACEHRYRSLVCRELGVMPDQIEYIAPCSPLQQAMAAKPAAESAYFITFRFSLSPDVSAGRLKDAWQRAFDVLPILRTKFVGTTDGFVQAAIKGLPLPWCEIRADEDMPIETVIQRTRFAWVSGNKESLSHPLEVVLIDSWESRVLALHIFHGLYDANSFQLTLDRVATEYQVLGGEVCQAADPTPAPTFLDALCHGPLQDFSSSKPFWVEHLDGAVLNSVWPRSPSASVITSQRKVPFKPLEELRRNLGVTHQALVQAAWVSVLARRLSVDPTIGIILSGRNIELDGAERVVGPLFNTLPFHATIRAKDGLTWSSLVRQCHDFNTTVVPFQHVPLRDIQKWCSRGRPLFDTLFSFQREHEDTPAVEHENMWTVLPSELEPNIDYPLALEAALLLDGGLELLLVAQQHHEPEASEQLAIMMDELEEALDDMAEDPEGLVNSGGRFPADKPNGGPVPNGDAEIPATNGHVKIMATNGHAPPPSKFTWTAEAILIRNEIADRSGVPREFVDATTPLFRVGLDSLDVVRICWMLKRQGLVIQLGDLAKAETLEDIMQHVHGYAPGPKRDAARERKISKIKSALRQNVVGELADGDIVLPTTPLQESMVVEMVVSDFQLYFNHDILEIAPSVDLDRLKDAWRAVIAGSPILRTRFLPVENPALASSYCQVIGTDSPMHMADVRLRTTDELDKVCQAATLRARQGAGRSDLLQLVFASVGTRRFLVLSIAHALYDGWSLGLIHRDVRAAYDGRYQAQSLESYISQVQGILFPEQDNDDSRYWAENLHDAPPTLLQEKHFAGERGAPVPDVPTPPVPEVPTAPVPEVSSAHVPDAPTPFVTDLPGECVPKGSNNAVSENGCGALMPSSSERSVVVDEYLGPRPVVHRDEVTSSFPLSEVTTFCKTRNITLHALGQACWAALLASMTGSADVTFGVVLACRDTEALEELVFPTMNTVAIRSVLYGTISGWLSYTQDHMRSIRLHQHFPLRAAQKLSRCHGQLFNTLFILQRGLPSSHGQGDEALMKSVGGASAVGYPVCVEMETADDRLVWRIACHGAYASQEETARMLGELDRVLGYVIRFPREQTVTFSGQEILICGLHPVGLKTADKTTTTPPNSSAQPDAEVWSPEEETIRDVLAEVSGVPAASILKSNTIYHLGLDSISAIKAASFLRREGVALQFRDMLKARSITEMAELAQKTHESPLRSPATSVGSSSASKFALPADLDASAILSSVGLDMSKVEDVLPASPMQVHTLSVWQNTKGRVFYPTFTYALSGDVNSSMISAAWQALVTELPILRTVFVATDSRSTPIVQIVLKPATPCQTSGSADDAAWASGAPEGVPQPYHLLHVHKDGDRWVVRLKIHHALYDAVSLSALMERFAAICSANDAQQPVTHLFNWRSMLNDISSAASRAVRRLFWDQYLAGTESSALCFPKKTDLDSNSRVSLVKPGAFQGISTIVKLCQARGVSLQALFFAAYARSIAASAVADGRDKPQHVIFGVYLANRAEHIDSGAEFYPFLRLVPLKVVLREGASLFEIAEEIQRDIHSISAPGIVDVGLWEVKDWTWVVVDSFVNFLHLGAPAPIVQGEGGKRVKLELQEEPVSDVSEARAGMDGEWEEGTGKEIAKIRVRDAFPDTVDVEVSVHGEDMTIGVFGPGERLGREGAAGVIQGIVEVLEGLVE